MSALPLDIDNLIWEYRIPGGLTVEVPGSQTVDALGRAVDASPTLTTFDPIAIHPADRRDLERLPEADRARETVAVYTTSALQTAGSSRPHVVQYQGERYEVSAVEDYATGGGVYRALAQRVEVTA